MRRENTVKKPINRRKHTHRHVNRVLMIVIVLLAFALIPLLYLIISDVSSDEGKDTYNKNVEEKEVKESIEEVWWDDDFLYKQSIDIPMAQGLGNIAQYKLSVNLPASYKNDVVKEDFVFLEYDIYSGEYKELPFDVVESKDPNLELSLAPINVNDDEKEYYVYYQVGGINYKSAIVDDVEQGEEIIFSEEVTHPLFYKLSRKWLLIGEEAIDESLNMAKLSFDRNLSEHNISSLKIELKNDGGDVVWEDDLSDDVDGEIINLSSAEVVDDNVPAGQYNILLYGKHENGKELKSIARKINISWPLYVNWSIDWEGDDSKDEWLNEIARISKKYEVPITHYFNPAIYIESSDEYRADYKPYTSPDRARYLTNWVLDRKNNHGDEIQLHLHMWYKMVDYLDIEVKTEPSWEPDGAFGHAVSSLAYSPEEFEKMIKWAKSEFKKNGLPEPKGYRAGGWHINEEHLKVLVDNGFTFDASGRNFMKFGGNQLGVPWALFSTTKPYRPSLADKNKPGEPEIGLWEFPNNGYSSSNYGAASTKMLDALKENYSGKPLKDKQVLSVLGHAQWFNEWADIPTTVAFFDEATKYLARDDNGPLVYTTIENVMLEYE